MGITGEFGHLSTSTIDKPEHAATYEEVCALSNDGARCPKCGGELISSFGLAGGGYGPMVFCDNDGCDFMKKHDLGPDHEG